MPLVHRRSIEVARLAKAECTRSTVAEALKALELAGVVTWQHRITSIRVRELDLFGQWASRWQVIRTSNAYAFIDPKPGSDPQTSLQGWFSSKSENPVGTRNQEFLHLSGSQAGAARPAGDALEKALAGLEATLTASGGLAAK